MAESSSVGGPSVVITQAAAELLARVRSERSGELAMVIGNGCCDSTAPFLFERYMAGPNEVEVSRLEGDVAVLLDAALIELFRGREVVIDAGVAATGGEDSFSCESEFGMRFSLERMPGLATP